VLGTLETAGKATVNFAGSTGAGLANGLTKTVTLGMYDPHLSGCAFDEAGALHNVCTAGHITGEVGSVVLVTAATGGAGDIGLAARGVEEVGEAAELARTVRIADAAADASSSGGATLARNFKFGNLPPGVLGETDKFGNITLQRGLTGQTFVETLRHETVHSVLSPQSEPLANARMWLYGKSGLYRYTEEAAAETYATKSIGQGLAFPLTNGYVTPLRLSVEFGGAAAATGGGAYGIYEAAR